MSTQNISLHDNKSDQKSDGNNLTKSISSNTEPQIYRTLCEYKKPETFSHALDFKSRYIVIDTLNKFMLIYRNEQEQKNKERFQYKLLLKNAKLSLKNIQSTPKCIILTIKKQHHTFYFKSNQIIDNVKK
eukprot:534411_1